MNQTEFNKVKAHSFHQYLGIKEIETNNGKATIPLKITENILNPSGTFHGGILYTICDVTCFCALLSLLEEQQIGVTNHISIQVMRAAKLGDIVTFEGQVLKKGKRLAFLECTVTVDGKLIAKASVTKTLLQFG